MDIDENPQARADWNSGIQTGEPMDIALRLLKLDYPDAERDAVLGDSTVPFPEQADEGLELPEERWEDEVASRTHDPESKKTITCFNRIHWQGDNTEEELAALHADVARRKEAGGYTRHHENALFQTRHPNAKVCGATVPIMNSWENPCPNPECGAWYNGNGMKLADDGGQSPQDEDLRNYTEGPEDIQTGEPMEIAMRLLKQGLELQPPPTQGVEETPPIQEDIPTVNVDTMSGGGDCCEEVRAWLLRGVRPNTKGYDKIMNASCEEIKSGQIGKTKFLYDKIAEIMGCSEGFSSDFQDIHTGEPMGIAMRLLKQQTHIGDWMDDPDYTGTPNVPFVPPEERAQFSPGALWVAGPGTGYPRTPEGMNALVGGYQLMHGEKPIGHVTQNIQQPLQTGGFRIGEASINPEHRGKGLYQRLLTSILGVQGGLESRGSRNRQSQRSHEMLQEALGGMPGVVSRSRSDYPGLPPAPGFPVPDDFDWARYYHDLDKAARHDYRYRRPESPEGWGSLRPMMPGELPVRSAPEGPRPGPTDGRLSQRTFDPSTGDMATYHSPSGYFGSTPWGEELPERTVPQRVMP